MAPVGPALENRNSSKESISYSVRKGALNAVPFKHCMEAAQKSPSRRHVHSSNVWGGELTAKYYKFLT
jgi:hypothetical protein